MMAPWAKVRRGKLPVFGAAFFPPPAAFPSVQFKIVIGPYAGMQRAPRVDGGIFFLHPRLVIPRMMIAARRVCQNMLRGGWTPPAISIIPTRSKEEADCVFMAIQSVLPIILQESQALCDARRNRKPDVNISSSLAAMSRRT